MSETKSNSGLMWVGVGLTVVTLLTGFAILVLRGQQRTVPPPPVYGTVAPFTLTNQNGEAVSLETLRGQVWVADIIFTRCAGPCLRMTKRMHELQQALPAGSATRLVSLTTDPDFDTPEVLRKYAARFNADTNRWLFLTGTKQQIAALATDSLKLTSIEKTPEQRASPEDLFIHSTIFVVVDRKGQLRAVFETEEDGAETVKVADRILPLIGQLERDH